MNQKIKRLLPDEHTQIGGKTRSGKSHCASLMHDVAPTSVYFNSPQKKQDETEINGVEASHETEFSDLVKAIEQVDSIQYLTHWKNSVMEEELRMVYEACKKASGEVYLFVDEAHLFDDSLMYAVRDGLGHGVHVIPISQQIKDYSDAVLENIETAIIFKVTEKQKGWFEYYGLPFEEIMEWCENDYHFVVWKNGEIEKHKPLPPP